MSRGIAPPEQPLALVELRPVGEGMELVLRRPPAHALSRAMLEDLEETLRRLERDLPRFLVVTGEGDRFFSAGLDLVEVCDLPRAEVETLASRLVGVLLRLFRFPAPVVAAVNGHAIAGGAVLALTADLRLMARGERLFGLNEVQVGLPLPAPLLEVVRAAVGPERAAEVLLEGRNFRPEEARAAGLVQELCEPADLLARARERAERLGRSPRSAFRRMKELLHVPAEALIERAGRQADLFVDIWFQEETRVAMRAARDRLLIKSRQSTVDSQQ